MKESFENRSTEKDPEKTNDNGKSYPETDKGKSEQNESLQKEDNSFHEINSQNEIPGIEREMGENEVEALGNDMAARSELLQKNIVDLEMKIFRETSTPEPDLKRINQIQAELNEHKRQLQGLKEFTENIKTKNYEKVTAPIKEFTTLYGHAYGENFESRRAGLNKQYGDPETIRVKDGNGKETGETIGVIDIVPDNLKDEVPITYFKGFSSGNAAYQNLLVELGMLGNRVIAMENPHGIDSSRITDDEKKWASQHQNNLPDIELRKTAMALETMEQKGIEKTDIIAHSEGAIYAILFALMHPEKVRSITLMDPAGMIGKDGFWNLIARTLGDASLQGENINKKIAGIDPRQEHHPDRELDKDETNKLMEEGAEAQANSKAGFDVWLKAWAAGPIKNIKAIRAIANSDITPALEYLREQGVTIGICHGVDDKVFSKDEMFKNMKPGMVDNFISITGTHSSFVHNPGKYAPVIDYMRTGLKNDWIKSQEDRPLDGFL